MELYINGKNVTISKDVFKKEISYKKCEHSVTGKFFLNIQSPRYFFGRYDLWDSSDEDKLLIVTDEGTTEYEFMDDRFWLVKDGVQINKIVEMFCFDYQNALEPHYEKGNVIAVLDNHVNTYKIKLYTDGSCDFILINSELVPTPDVIDEEHEDLDDNDVEVESDDIDNETMLCKRVCHYNINGMCIYFDEAIRLNNNLEHPHTCEDPFFEAEGNED